MHQKGFRTAQKCVCFHPLELHYLKKYLYNLIVKQFGAALAGIKGDLKICHCWFRLKYLHNTEGDNLMGKVFYEELEINL